MRRPLSILEARSKISCSISKNIFLMPCVYAPTNFIAVLLHIEADNTDSTLLECSHRYVVSSLSIYLSTRQISTLSS